MNVQAARFTVWMTQRSQFSEETSPIGKVHWIAPAVLIFSAKSSENVQVWNQYTTPHQAN